MVEFTYSPLTHPDEIRVLTLHPGVGTDQLQGSIKHIQLSTSEPQSMHPQDDAQSPPVISMGAPNLTQLQTAIQAFDSILPSTLGHGYLPYPDLVPWDPWQAAESFPAPEPAHPEVWSWGLVQREAMRLRTKGGVQVMEAGTAFEFKCSRRSYGKQEYDALSYIWGDPTPVEILVVSDQYIGIARNVYGALIQLRSPTKTRRLWIDAICIEQDNIMERNHQVQMMKRVFSDAASVIVWLGDLPSNVTPTLDMILGFNTGTQKPILKYQKEALEGLANIFRRPWWRRMWIVQEAVAARELVIMLGPTIFPWKFMRNLCQAIQLDEFRKDDHAPILRSCRYQKFTALDKFRQTGHMPLVSLLRCTRDYQASDPRDKLYALLGLASDIGPEDFFPDYSKPAQRVWEDLVKFMVTRRHSLDIICSAQFFAPAPGIPGLQSWLPSWQTPSTTHLSTLEPIGKYDGCASGDTEPVVDLSHFPRVLIAEGIVVDTVELYGGSITVAHECLSTIRRWRYLASQRMDSQNMGCFWRVIVADRDHMGNLATDRFGRDFEPFIEGSNQGLSRRTQNFSEAVTRAVMGRRFFITRKGRLGLGPREIQVGDKIVILKGCYMPLVLRADGEFRILVGEAYVSGIMRGEAFTGPEAGRYKARMMKLK